MRIVFREVYGETIVVFFLPALLAWLAAFAGFSRPLDDAANLFAFCAFWVAVEACAFLFYINGVKDWEKLGVNVVWIVLYSAIGVLLGPIFTDAVMVVEDVDDEDAERAYFAGITLVSAFFPLLVGVGAGMALVVRAQA